MAIPSTIHFLCKMCRFIILALVYLRDMWISNVRQSHLAIQGVSLLHRKAPFSLPPQMNKPQMDETCPPQWPSTRTPPQTCSSCLSVRLPENKTSLESMVHVYLHLTSSRQTICREIELYHLLLVFGKRLKLLCYRFVCINRIRIFSHWKIRHFMNQSKKRFPKLPLL